MNNGISKKVLVLLLCMFVFGCHVEYRERPQLTRAEAIARVHRQYVWEYREEMFLKEERLLVQESLK